MSTRFTKEWYKENQGKKVTVNGTQCLVTSHRTESRGGSWERGFRFYHSQWAMLTCMQPKKIPSHLKRVKWAAKLVAKMKKEKVKHYSMDHGTTWHTTPQDAMKSKGKMKLSSGSEGELAFEGIQQINRKYNPNYQWHK